MALAVCLWVLGLLLFLFAQFENTHWFLSPSCPRQTLASRNIAGTSWKNSTVTRTVALLINSRPFWFEWIICLSWGFLIDEVSLLIFSWMQDAKDHLPELVAWAAGVKWNSKHPQGPVLTSSHIFLERDLPVPLFRSLGLCFLKLLWKCSKINQKSSLRRVPVTSLSALLLKFQKEQSDNRKYIQLLVKLMSYCHTFKETLISSQRAGVSLSRARGKLGVVST